MKILALALTILLAAGSQARFLQADAPPPPSPLDQIRSAGGLYLDELNKILKKALEHLDGTEYSEHKDKISDGLDTIRAKIKTGSEYASPYTDAFATQIVEATKDMREQITSELKSLKEQINPMGEELHKVLEKHIEQYRAKLEPEITKYSEEHKKHVEELKNRLEPVLEELRGMFEKNLEETKSKLMPILELLREKGNNYLEALQKIVKPYFDEYYEHMATTASNTKPEDLPSKIQALTDELKAKLQAVWETHSQPKTS